jgi:O-acetyl-ADP-ribose deacetylase
MSDRLTINVGDARLYIKQGDLTQEASEAIVNAANSGLMGGGGVDGAIHRAGGPAILEECRRIVAERGRLPAGQAVITTAGKLKAKYVIHTVGPIWNGGGRGEAETLASAYRESLKLAAANNIKSVVFPSISTGAYGYPLKEAAEIALKTIKEFLFTPTSVKEAGMVLWGEENYRAYEAAMRGLEDKKQ